MSPKTSMTCILCGGNVRTASIRGQSWPFRDIQDLVVSEDLELPACTSCGELWLNDEDSRRLGEVLERAYNVRRQEETALMIEHITSEFALRQSEIEHILGLSTGYISKVKRLEKVISPQTYRFLFLLHEDPYATVAGLSRLDPSLAPIAERLEVFQHSEVTH